MRLFSCFAALVLTLSGPAMSDSVGLLVGSYSYDSLPEVRRGGRISRAVPELEQSGMQVSFLRSPSQQALTEALANFGQQASQADALLVALSGRFLRSATETYYLPADATAGPLATLHTTALPLSTILAVLADKPGRAVLILSTDDREARFGPSLSFGIGPLDIPQGVTVLIGTPTATTKVVSENISQPGRPFVGAARQNGIVVTGYAPDTLVLMDGATPPPVTTSNRLKDIQDWRAASAANTVEAYEGYLEAHPRGEFVDMASNRIRALTDTPEARAERTEQALDLNRDARRDIQRDLSLLGFNTRGIDGIFGRGTRAAVAEWQRRERFEATGFVTAEQIELLNRQAAARAAELEAEAEARRQEQLAADVAYWNQTGSNGDEAGLRAYLNRFPDGEFAELANERLAVIEERKRARASRLDRQLWEETTSRNTAAAYERYLVESPNGAFREEAQARIVALQRENEFADAARAEAAMNMTPGTRRIVEARLNAIGLRPGPVDGVFDNDTRRAIRRYQAARNLPESGYVSEQMMVQLMADTVRQIFR